MARYQNCEASPSLGEVAAARQDAELLFRDCLHRYRAWPLSAMVGDLWAAVADVSLERLLYRVERQEAAGVGYPLDAPANGARAGTSGT